VADSETLRCIPNEAPSFIILSFTERSVCAFSLQQKQNRTKEGDPKRREGYSDREEDDRREEGRRRRMKEMRRRGSFF
jgi:hypothetical protein